MSRRRSSTTRHIVTSLGVVAAGLGFLSGAEAADTPPASLPPVVISATRLPTPADEIASSVTVITAEDMARKQQRTVSDALRAVPGLNLVQVGGPGGTTSVFTRGTNSNHTKVILDGVNVSDPSTPGGAFDFAHLLTSDLERIEVLRGPQSGLYGSDAIGGVIVITTKKGSGPARFTGSLEGGSFGTFNQSGSARGSHDRFNYAFNVDHFHSSGTPVTPLNLLPAGRERVDDAYDNKTFSTNLGARIAEGLEVGIVARYIESGLAFTGNSGFPSVPAVSHSHSDTRQIFTRGTVDWSLFDGMFDQTFGLGYTEHHREDRTASAALPSINRGNRIKLDWLGTIKVMPGQVVTLGAEHQVDEIRGSPIGADTTLNSGFAQLQSSFGKRFFHTFSLRYDDNDRFGGQTTYRFAPVFLVTETDTKLKGSVGTGFKAPSLNQLFVSFPAFGFFANPNLRPEESFGYDFGFEQGLFDDRVQFGVTYFHNDIDNLIATGVIPGGLTNVNVAQATASGLETFVAWTPWRGLDIRADYTYTLQEDAMLHQQLLRRPKHKASLDASWRPIDALSLSATVLFSGANVDANRSFSIPRLQASSYTTANLAANYDVTDWFAVFARINNVLDRRYEVPTGFEQPGIGGFAGIRVQY